MSLSDDPCHVIAALNIDFSFGFQPMPISQFLNTVFFDDNPVFFDERGQWHGQMGLFNLMDSSLCTSLGSTPVQIWNFRGNALTNFKSKQMHLILNSATSVLVFVNDSCKQNSKYWKRTIQILNMVKSSIGKYKCQNNETFFILIIQALVI